MSRHVLFDGAASELGLLPLVAPVTFITATVTKTLGAATLSSVGNLTGAPITGTVGETLGAATLFSVGNLTGAPITGTVGETLNNATLSSSGTIASAGITGATAATLQLASLIATGTLLTSVTGTVIKTLGTLSGNLSGGFLIDPDTALRGLIAANGEIALLVGQRIYPITTPDNPTFPLIVITRKQTTRDHLMSDSGRFVKILFQIDVFAERVAGGVGGALLSRRIANRIRATINEFRGSYSNITFHGILNSNESESYDSELEIYRVSQEYLVMTWDPF